MLSPNGKQKAARVFNTRNHTSSVVDFQNGLICSPPTKEMVQKILVQYSNEPDGPELDDPTVESMSQLVHQWSPNLHVVCMYARWSKKIRCNYHLDTINTLLCVAEHTKYSPYELLSKVVSIQIAQSRKVFGLSFLFHFLNIVDIDKEQLKLQFTSLAVTLRVLETSVVSSISGSPGKQKNSSRLPTVKTIETRMWTSLEHRWLSFKMVEVLFEEWLLKQKDEQVALHFSFRIHEAAGLSRFDFLNPLVGICFRYRNIEIILNLKDELKNVWETPSSFVSYGNSLLAHTTDRVKLLVDSFTEARSLVQFYRVTFTRKRTRIDKWIMLRAYVFQLWLERKQNEDLKKEVDTLLNQHTLETRIKPQTLLPALTVEAHSKTNNLIPPVTTKCLSSDCPHNGLLQLLQSRKKTVPIRSHWSQQNVRPVIVLTMVCCSCYSPGRKQFPCPLSIVLMPHPGATLLPTHRLFVRHMKKKQLILIQLNGHHGN